MKILYLVVEMLWFYYSTSIPTLRYGHAPPHKAGLHTCAIQGKAYILFKRASDKIGLNPKCPTCESRNSDHIINLHGIEKYQKLMQEFIDSTHK